MTIDARGKACPQPVVLSLHALAELKEGEILEVWVDNEAAVENLKRMAAQKGRPTTVYPESGVLAGADRRRPRVTPRALPSPAAAAP